MILTNPFGSPKLVYYSVGSGYNAAQVALVDNVLTDILVYAPGSFLAGVTVQYSLQLAINVPTQDLSSLWVKVVPGGTAVLEDEPTGDRGGINVASSPQAPRSKYYVQLAGHHRVQTAGTVTLTVRALTLTQLSANCNVAAKSAYLDVCAIGLG